jgi:hypothetical protein
MVKFCKEFWVLSLQSVSKKVKVKRINLVNF